MGPSAEARLGVRAAISGREAGDSQGQLLVCTLGLAAFSDLVLVQRQFRVHRNGPSASGRPGALTAKARGRGKQWEAAARRLFLSVTEETTQIVVTF